MLVDEFRFGRMIGTGQTADGNGDADGKSDERKPGKGCEGDGGDPVSRKR